MNRRTKREGCGRGCFINRLCILGGKDIESMKHLVCYRLQVMASKSHVYDLWCCLPDSILFPWKITLKKGSTVCETKWENFIKPQAMPCQPLAHTLPVVWLTYRYTEAIRQLWEHRDGVVMRRRARAWSPTFRLSQPVLSKNSKHLYFLFRKKRQNNHNSNAPFLLKLFHICSTNQQVLTNEYSRNPSRYTLCLIYLVSTLLCSSITRTGAAGQLYPVCLSASVSAKQSTLGLTSYA